MTFPNVAGLAHAASLLCIIASGCSRAPTQSAPASRAVTTDRASYVLASGPPAGVDIGVVFRNPSRDSVYLAHCGREIAVEVEREDQAGWAPREMRWCPATATAPLVVWPGEAHAFTFRLRALPNAAPESLAGVVRLNVHAFSSRSASTHSDYSLLIADSLRATAPFRITR